MGHFPYFSESLRAGLGAYQHARAADPRMRGMEVIDAELQLMAAVRHSIRDRDDKPSSHQVDALLE
jgi:hypothetical protein